MNPFPSETKHSPWNVKLFYQIYHAKSRSWRYPEEWRYSNSSCQVETIDMIPTDPGEHFFGVDKASSNGRYSRIQAVSGHDGNLPLQGEEA